MPTDEPQQALSTEPLTCAERHEELTKRKEKEFDRKCQSNDPVTHALQDRSHSSTVPLQVVPLQSSVA
jgi:hypothetical protein